MDSNTDRDKSADPHIVELLWANRFGLNATALERAQLYIRKPEDWIEEDNEDCSSYHSVFPEYKVSHYSEDDRTGYEYYLFSQFDSTPHWWRIDITYHQTVLYSRMGIALDGGRAFVPCPEKEFIDLHSSSNPLMICCYVKGSMRYDLFRFFCEKDTATEAEYAIHRFLECIIVFESESEKQGFLEYARYKIENYTLDEDRLFLKEMPECYYKDYMTAIKAQRLLRIYRLLQTKSAEEDLDYATNECGVAHSEDMG